MGRSKRHGRQPHKARGVCRRKGSAFTTWEAAAAAAATTPDAERPYRGTCCGYYHITSKTIDEFAQRVAQYMPPRQVDLTWLEEEEHDERPEREADAGDAAATTIERRGESRFTPTPRAVARAIARSRRKKESA